MCVNKNMIGKIGRVLMLNEVVQYKFLPMKPITNYDGRKVQYHFDSDRGHEIYVVSL